MDKLQIFVCCYRQHHYRLPNRLFLQQVELNSLLIGEYQTNQISETRIFLSDLVNYPAEYIGFVSSNYDSKFTTPFETDRVGQRILPVLANLGGLNLAPDILHCVVLSHVQCKEWFAGHFDGMAPYLDDIETQFPDFSFNDYPSILANSFVCHHEVLKEYLSLWRPIFDYCWRSYPVEELANNIGGFADKNRAAGYLYEAVSMMVWAKVIKRRKLDLRYFAIPTKKIKRILI